MARNCKGMIGLLMVFFFASASALGDRGFFADNLSSSKVSKVKTANYYGHSNTELSCLSQLNFKSCRYTGCPQCVLDTETGTQEDGDIGLTNLFFQTDFTCCPKDQTYSYDRQHDVGQLGFSDKVGTCDWEVSVYRWPLELGNIEGNLPELSPVLTDDGTALKWGTAWGTCYLNAEAEHCDHPLCERMAINIQGGLYGSLAYGDTAELSLPAFEETCGGETPDWCRFFPGDCNSDRRTAAPVSGKVNAKQLDVVSPFGVIMNTFVQLTALTVGTTITGSLGEGGGEEQKKMAAQRCPEVNGRRAPVCGPDSVTRKKATTKGQTAAAETTNSLYPGVALIISGPFHVTSKHDDKYEETGLFEFAPFFLALAEPVAEAPDAANITYHVTVTQTQLTTHTNLVYSQVNQITAVNTNYVCRRWPVVRGKGAKIRFTKEQNSYGEQSYGYDNKYEQKYDDKYGGDKEYYERKEYHRER